MTCKIFKFYCDAIKQDTIFEYSGIKTTEVKVSIKLVCWCLGNSYHGNSVTCTGKVFPFTKLLNKLEACVRMHVILLKWCPQLAWTTEPVCVCIRL
jgi:hypothetical protein